MRDKSQANISDRLGDGRNASIGHNYVAIMTHKIVITVFLLNSNTFMGHVLH